MQEKIIVINCQHSDKDTIKKLQEYLFNIGYCWNSAKYSSEKKYKDIINLLILDGTNMFNGHENILSDIGTDIDIIRFNSPTDYMRYFKIKKLKTKIT